MTQIHFDFWGETGEPVMGGHQQGIAFESPTPGPG